MANSSQSGWMAKLAQPQTPAPWSLFDVGSAWIVLFLATAMLGPALVLPTGGQPTLTVLLLGWLIGQMVTLGFVYITRRRQPESFNALRIVKTRQPIPFLLLIGAGLILTLDVIGALGSGIFLQSPELAGISTSIPIDWFFAAVFMVIVQPITEEIVFRGLTLPKLREVMGGRGGWVASAILFALFHFLVYGARLAGTVAFWYAFIVPLLMGLFLGAIRITSGSTRAAIIVRMGGGLFAVLAAFALQG